MRDKRIGILMGGLSAEREVSVATGEAIGASLDARGYATVPIFMDSDVDQILRQEPIDAAFIALHGAYGEDGCIQGMLEIMGIPYTGPGVAESALAMDKLKAKELFRLHNLKTPPYYCATTAELDALEALHGCFGYPVFVKPRRQGSSIGAGRADDLDELIERCEEGLRFDRAVLVERFVPAREIAVGVLDGRALGSIEIEPSGGVYDYKAKYGEGLSRYHQPPRLPKTRIEGIERIAEKAIEAVGADGAVRVDLLVSEGENEYVLEVNTLPGMTPTSLLPKIAAAAGLDFGDLCEEILARACLKVGPRAYQHLGGASERSTTLVDEVAPMLGHLENTDRV